MRLFSRRNKTDIDRRMALGGVPVLNPAIDLETTENGVVRVSMTLKRGRGLFESMRPKQYERSYELDTFGTFAVNLVDGKRTVLDIIDAFEERFRLSRRETELSVVAFFKLLMQRGVLTVTVDLHAASASGARPGQRLAGPVAALLVLMVASRCATGQTTAATSPDETLSGIKQLCSAPRLPGSIGNRALESLVEERFTASGFESGQMAFDAPLYSPGNLKLDCGEDGVYTLEAMHPALMRPGNFNTAEFNTRLVYMGKGGPDALTAAEGIPLKGAIAVMDYECGSEWLELLRFGFDGVVFVGDGDSSHREAVEKVYKSEVAVPRYFIDGEQGQALLKLVKRQRDVPADAVNTPCRWKMGTLRNFWVLIPGSDPVLSENVMVFTAPLDANAVVPSRAYGAQRALNLHILLKMLEDFQKKPPKHSVILAAVNAHTQLFAGERMLAWHLLSKTSQVEEPRENMTQDMRIAQLHLLEYGRLKLEPVAEADKKDLHILLEVLRKVEEMQKAAVKLSAAAESGEIPLNLTDVTEAELRAALDAAEAKLLDEYGSRRAKMAGDDPETLDTQRTEDLVFIQALRELHFEAFLAKARRIESVFEDERLLDSWRAAMDERTGKRIYIKSKLQDAFKSRRNRVGQDLLIASSPKLSTMDDDVREQRIAEIKKRQSDLLKILVLFNKLDVGVGRSRTYYRQVAANDEQREMFKAVVDEFVEKYGRWQERLEAALRRDVASGAIRKALGTRKVKAIIHLDLDAQADRVGFCRGVRSKTGSKTSGFGNICMNVALASSTNGAVQPYVDAIGSAAEYDPNYWFELPNSPADQVSAVAGTPSFAFKSAFTPAGRIFGPWDTPDQIDPERLHRVEQWSRNFLIKLLDNPDLLTQESLNVGYNQHDSWTTRLRTFSLEQFTGKPIPTLEIPDSLVAIYHKETHLLPMPAIIAGDVANAYMTMSDDTGSAIVYGIRPRGQLFPLAYKMDPDFREVLYAIDKGRVQSSKQLNSNLGKSPSATIPLFEAREFVIWHRSDPTMLGDSKGTIQHTYWPKEAGSQSDPDKYGVHGARSLSPASSEFTYGPVGIYLERKRKEMTPDRLMVISRNLRCLLGATEENPRGEGYADPAAFPHDFVEAAAADMAILNRSRNKDMKGVVNQLLDEFLDRSDELNAEIKELNDKNDHRGVIIRSAQALGMALKAHSQLASMNADMLKAIVAYMSLMLPFCFFLQKLLFNFKRMEHELAAFMATFVSLYIAFRFIHPAFKIAMSPEAIFIAFVLGAIGVFTTLVLRMRFSEEMRLVFQNAGGIGEEAQLGTVGQTAVLIGVQNMRRRRVRTTLTTATIVLVVFTMLAFSSVSKKASPTLITKSDAAPYSGFFFRFGGDSRDESNYRVVRDLFAGRASICPRRQLRNTHPIGRLLAPMRMELTDDPETFIELHSVTGIRGDDVVFRESMAMVEGQGFSAPDAYEILLPTSAADALNLGASDVGKTKLRLNGREWLLRGLLNDQRYRLARDLDPEYSLVPADTGAAPAGEDGEEEEIGDLLSDGATLVNTARIAIIPEQVAAEMGGAISSVSVIFPLGTPDTTLTTEVQRLLATTHARFFMGSRVPFKISPEAKSPIRPGSYYIGSGYRTSIGGLATLIIPLIIAGSIILNTMLGTVYERKSEIAVFNAIGLNPTHIFLFFLAEAFVYSLLGSVGGYLIGQSLAMGVKATGLISGVNINFSSLIVVYAILFTMGLVLLSTIYPGYVATRSAVPSGKRKWAMPDHTDGNMNIIFPFIYRPQLAPGAMMYLHDFFSGLTDQSLGDIVANLESVTESKDATGRFILALRYNVALAPYDLGVTQNVTFTTQYDDVVKSYRLHMRIDRLSGQETNWVTTNKPFLERMRKYLLRWRNIDPTRQNWFVQRADSLFETLALREE